ncbi:hypothetical protein Poli38472_008172 [Pythium oligandrum]|uniref:Ribosomal RNA-processing protein 7 C-terminal domain-containing protein n=1 Tax=Pythium oligandrum TaxID=41045 RepID=A0A8K1CLM8_PYTOL|nr:hypothetical protein Poli38472_008172 [Pythium oligandrum]|eukprot:TMW65530.1 hypothetical protein Poli38472_008172 [Pythium oligandrum]
MASGLVGGYHAIALPLAHGVFKRHIYVKKHNTKESEKGGESKLAADRTVYVVNLPNNSDEDWLQQCLSAVGSIQHIIPGSEPDQNADPLLAKTAHVVFKSKKAAEEVLRVQTLDCPAPAETTGLNAYLEDYQAKKPGLVAVKELADRFMAEFDAAEEEEIREREDLKNQVDDDGFITVVSNKRKKAPIPEELMPVKKPKSKELQNFYRFQMREKKRDQLKTLRERFEEDKLLVEKLKKANKFKPE